MPVVVKQVLQMGYGAHKEVKPFMLEPVEWLGKHAFGFGASIALQMRHWIKKCMEPLTLIQAAKHLYQVPFALKLLSKGSQDK